MATRPIEEQAISNLAEPPADVRVSVGPDPSQSEGAPDIEDIRGSVGSAPSESGRESGISGEELDVHHYRPLMRAAFKGDWESAKRFLEGDSASKTAKITSRSETVLHVAALSAQDQFLENLVELLSPYPKALEMVDCDGRTALHNAVLCGRIRMVKALVRINPKLTQLADNEERVPLGISAREASMHKEIAWFLAERTTNDGPSHPFSSSSAMETIIDLTHAGHHGISVDLKNEPTDKDSDPALQCLTRSLWNATKIVVPIIKRVHEVKLRHVAAVKLAERVCNSISSRNTTEITDLFRDWDLLYQATAKGISELVKLFIQSFPELIQISPHGWRLTKHAVEFRQERIIRLFLKVSSTNELSLVPGPTLEESMSMMNATTEHAAAEYYPSFDVATNVAGAAFQMQRELQWYKAVEMWVMPEVRFVNPDNTTYWQIFVEKHQTLLENGQKWVKDTANSCMLVSTLIATVLFAAAFTVPGGNDGNTGVPLILGQDSLLIFAISDTLGLFSSVMAILLFLAILTSRYEAQDFLHSLPENIIMGLCFLFLSLAFMLVAFATTLTIVLDKRLEWVLIPITLLACVPVALFAIQQLPLLFQMVKSTYGASIFRPESIWE